MPVRMLNFVTTPPPPRKFSTGSPIAKTEEWQDLVLALGAGLRPQEYICVEFAPDAPIRKLVKHPTVGLILAIKKKIREMGLPYDVYARGELVTIIGRGVIS